MAYAAHHPGTLVIVTADHAHTSQIIPPQTDADHSPGLTSTLITADGALDGRELRHEPRGSVAGAHRDTASGRRDGDRGADEVEGLIDQTELFEIMRHQLGIA